MKLKRAIKLLYKSIGYIQSAQETPGSQANIYNGTHYAFQSLEQFLADSVTDN